MENDYTGLTTWGIGLGLIAVEWAIWARHVMKGTPK